MGNLEIYEKVKDVPSVAKKPISAGRLKGFTDINPMWRIKKMTEVFGPCGIGWTANIADVRIDEGASGEKSITIMVKVKIKQNNEWSEPFVGVGGSMLIAKEKDGLRLDDEAYKKAYTDALSVAFKMLGVGASVYFEKDPDGKYETENEPQPQIKRAVDNSQPKPKISRVEVENKPQTTPQSELEDFIKANKTKLSWQSFVAPLIQSKYEKRLPAELKNDEAIELLAILKNKIKEDEL